MILPPDGVNLYAPGLSSLLVGQWRSEEPVGSIDGVVVTYRQMALGMAQWEALTMVMLKSTLVMWCKAAA